MYIGVGQRRLNTINVAVAQSFWSIAAAWVEAGGTIGAVIGAAWIAAGDSRAARRREEAARKDVEVREERRDLATKAAAVNVAILAATQIHDLHILLADEAWRARVTRVSPSRTLLATENMLIAFPIQTLVDAPSMVSFSRFPAALATAAEIYVNLELAVRSAAEGDRPGIFAEYTKQMARVDLSAQKSLGQLRKCLRLDAPAGASALSKPD